MKKRYLAAAALITISSAAYAADHSDIRLLKETKISLVEAIKAAEKEVGGDAIEASIDSDAWKPAYEVSVAKGQQLFDVQVDGVTGKVIASREDSND